MSKQGASPEAAKQSLALQQALGKKLVEGGLAQAEHVQQALEQQVREGGKMFAILLQNEQMDKGAFHQLMSRQQGTASIDLANYEIAPEVLSMLDEAFVRANWVLPIDKMGSLMSIAMVCPADAVVLEQVTQMTELKVKAVLAHYDGMIGAFTRYYRAKAGEKPVGDFDHITGGGSASAKAAPADAMKEKMAEVTALPAFSSSLLRLQEASGDPKAGVKEVAAIVRRDPQLAMRILSIANASAYGMSDEVTDVGVAVLMLGKPRACELLLKTPVAKEKEAVSLFNFPAYATRSAFCAAAAHHAAKVCGKAPVWEAYTAGLLHQVGRLALALTEPELYGEKAKDVSGPELLKIEQALFKGAHPDAGACVAEHWGLPTRLCDAIRNHRTPDKARSAPALAVIVGFAALLADAKEAGGRGEALQSAAALGAKVGLAPEHAQAIFKQVEDALAKG